MDHSIYLSLAFQEAKKALEEGNPPIGAVLVTDERIIAQAHNQVNTLSGHIHHAEMTLIMDSQKYLLSNRWNTTLYTTLEPCIMCMGTIIFHHIQRVVWAVDDYWAGASRIYDYSCEYLKRNKCELVGVPDPQIQSKCVSLLKEYYLTRWDQEKIVQMLGAQY